MQVIFKELINSFEEALLDSLIKNERKEEFEKIRENIVNQASKEQFGDFQCNICLVLSKIYKNIEISANNNLREINIGKSDEFSKHQIIEKMWEDKNFKVETGESQKECYDRMEIFLKDTFEIFKKEKINIIFVTHGNLIGIILKYFFNLEFDFKMWKQISMPDFYEIVFDENYLAKDVKRDIENIDNLFYIK